MANFFLDNQDIQFLFDHLDLDEMARSAGAAAQRTATPTTHPPTRPTRSTTTAASWRSSAQVAAETIAPNAEQVDREGNTLNEDGTVTLHPLVRGKPAIACPRPT